MTSPSVSQLLDDLARGDPGAADAVFTRLYGELKGLAAQVRRGRAGETMNTTALTNEAYLKLMAGRAVAWKGRAHFFAVAARAMRQVLIDAARRRGSEKRGGGNAWPVTLDEAAGAAPMRPAELIALDEALTRLASMDGRRARVVECRFFGGLTVPETAEVLGVSEATVERDWRTARAWLALELGGKEPA